MLRCGGRDPLKPGTPNHALEQTRDSALRCGESVGCELLNLAVRRNQLNKSESEPMNKTTLVVLFAFLPIVCGGVMGMILGGVDPASATRVLELRSS